MRKALTLTATLYFLGLSACYPGFYSPACAQDPKTLFGGDEAPPAATLSKTGAAGKKAAAGTPAQAQGKGVASSRAKPAAGQAKTAPPTATSLPPTSASAANTNNTSAAAATSARAATSATSVHTAKTSSTRAGARPASKPTSKSISPHATAAAGPRAVPSQFPRASGPPPASPVLVRAYCSKLWNKIQNNWDLASGKNHVILGVDVDAGGNVTATKVSSQPQNGDAEAKAQAALTKSQPLETLPTGLPCAHLTITFDSTADPHGDSNSHGRVSLEYNPSASAAATMPATPAAPIDTAPGADPTAAAKATVNK